MYACIYGHRLYIRVLGINRIRLPILLVVAAEQEKRKIPYLRSRLGSWSRETGSAVPSRVILLILHIQTELGAYSRDSSRFPRRCHSPFIYVTANHHRVSPEFIRSRKMAYRWHSLPRVRRYRASSLQRSSSNECCCLFGYHQIT